MAKNNKAIRYIRYAIGEIVLVVIGILIALNINNWNEHRKNQRDVQQSLVQVLNDLKQDRQLLKQDFLLRQKYVLLLTEVSNGNYQDVHLDSLTKYLDNYFYFFKSNNAYSGLKETGKFSNISNARLKADITSYYEQVYDILIADTKYGEAFTNQNVIPWVIDNLKPDSDYLVSKELVRSKLETSNLWSLINYQIGLYKFVNEHLQTAIADNEKLISQIEAELGKSQK